MEINNDVRLDLDWLLIEPFEINYTSFCTNNLRAIYSCPTTTKRMKKMMLKRLKETLANKNIFIEESLLPVFFEIGDISK